MSSTLPLPPSGPSLAGVDVWICSLVSTATAQEAVDIAAAIEEQGITNPTELAGLLCEDGLYNEIKELTKHKLTLRHRSILNQMVKSCREAEAEEEHQKKLRRSEDSSADKAKKEEPQLTASDIKKIFEDSGTAPPCLDLLAGPELFRKLTRDNARTEAAFPGRKPFTLVDLFKDAKPLEERDLTRPMLPKDGDLWEAIQSIFELKEDDKGKEARKRSIMSIVEWNRYWFTYAYAAIACGQLTKEIATSHCNNVCTLGMVHSTFLALRYDQMVRARLSQLVANGTHTAEKLSETDAPLVGELLNEQMSNFNRKKQASNAQDGARDGSRKKQKTDWVPNNKGNNKNANKNPDAAKGKGKGKGKGKKSEAPSSPQ